MVPAVDQSIGDILAAARGKGVERLVPARLRPADGTPLPGSPPDIPEAGLTGVHTASVP